MAGNTERGTLADRVQDAIHDAWVEGAEAHKLATYDASEARQKAVELAAALRGSAPPTGPSVSENLIAYCDARIEKLLVARDKAKEAGRVGVERCRQSDIETLLEVREVVLAETARAAAAEPRTVGPTLFKVCPTCGRAGVHSEDCPTPDLPLPPKPAAAPEGSPAPEPRTSERETIMDEGASVLRAKRYGETIDRVAAILDEAGVPRYDDSGWMPLESRVLAALRTQPARNQEGG